MPWGVGPWGETPWGDGGGVTGFGLLRAYAVRENVVRAFFTSPIYWTRHLDPLDGARPELYDVAEVAGTVGIDGRPVRPVRTIQVVPSNPDPLAPVSAVDVVVDRDFSPYGARYVLSVGGLVTAADADPLDPSLTSLEFEGLQRGLPSYEADLQAGGGDIANPQSLSALLDPQPRTDSDQLLGTFQADDTGDYARDEGLESLRKRIVRRLTTRKDAFAHLAGYGVGFPNNVKRLATPGLRQSLSADAEEQVRQEPEVVSVKVELVVGAVPGLFRWKVKAKTSIGRDLDLDFPFAPIGD